MSDTTIIITESITGVIMSIGLSSTGVAGVNEGESPSLGKFIMTEENHAEPKSNKRDIDRISLLQEQINSEQSEQLKQRSNINESVDLKQKVVGQDSQNNNLNNRPKKFKNKWLWVLILLLLLGGSVFYVDNQINNRQSLSQDRVNEQLSDQIHELKNHAEISKLEVKNLQSDLASFTDLLVTNSAYLHNLEVSGNTTLNGLDVDTIFTALSSLDLQGPIYNSSNNNNGRIFVDDDLQVTGAIYGNFAGGINPGFTTGSIIFQGPSGLSQDNNNFFYDALNKRIGVGINAPLYTIDVSGSGVVARFSGRVIGSDAINANEFITLAQLNAVSGGNFFLQDGNSFGAIASLGTNDNFALAFETNNTEHIRVTTSGNVGIGTTTPSTFKLEVAGNIGPEADNTRDIGSSGRRFANLYATNVRGTLIPTGFTQGSVAFAGSGGTLTQDNSNFFWDDTNKRLGVGNAGPAHRLSVSGEVNASAQGPIYVKYSGTNQIGVALTLDAVGAGAGSKEYSIFSTGVASAAGAGSLAIYNVTDGRYDLVMTPQGHFNFAQNFYTDTSSQVNIIPNGTGIVGLNIRGSVGQTANLINLETSAAVSLVTVSPVGRVVLQNSSNATNAFQVADSSGTIVLNTDTQNLRVGINTSVPSTALHVNGGLRVTSLASCNTIDTDANGVFSCGTDETAGAGQAFLQAGNSFGAIASLGTNDNFALAFETNNVERIRVTTSGNVGIGNTDPDRRLTVTATDISTSQINLRSIRGAILSGNVIGGIDFFSDDTNLTAPGNKVASIQALASATHTGTVNDTDLVFSTTTATTMSERLRINSVGDVGINTTAPDAKLDIKGASVHTDTDVKHYRNVVSYKNNVASVTGTMRFNMPKGWSNTMMNVTIRGYNYSADVGAWEVVVGGYNLDGPVSDAWIHYTAEIRGSAPFSQVRLAAYNGKVVILLGDTSTVWNYPHAVVSDVIVSQTNLSGWGTGWSVDVTTSEAGVSSIVTPPIRTYQTSNGNVGIGTTSPGSRLDVYNATVTSNVDIFRILSDVGSSANVKFRIDSDGDIFTDGSTTIGTPADVAEKYQNFDNAKAGDVVVFSAQNSGIAHVVKSSQPYQKGLAGVVSSEPGIILSGNTDGVPVALSGRVPTKVSVSNGAIETGDYLTSGPNGVAIRASKIGPIIGTALESTQTDGTIEVFVHVGSYTPTSQELIQGQNNNLYGINNFMEINVTNKISTHNLTVTGNATFEGSLSVQGETTVARIVIKGHVVGNDDTRGNIIVKANQLSAVYRFKQKYDIAPIIIVTPVNNFAPPFRIESTVHGFNLHLKDAVDYDLQFNFQAQQ